jgi:hypothetical protein
MNKLNVSSWLLVAVLFAVGAQSVLAADRMKSGQWEVTISANGRSATNTHCDPPGAVKMTNGSSEEIRSALEKSAVTLQCKLQDFKMDDTNISYSYACADKTMETKTSYHDGNTFETTRTTKVGGQEQTSVTKGRRVGECPKGSE